MTASISERMVEFALDLEYDDIPPDVVRAAKLHLLDTVGCGLAANALGLGTAGRAIAAESADTMSATVIGRLRSAPAADAALANGMLCHALDFDDTHGASICHVNVVAVPSILAAAETIGGSGRDLLAALVVANELITRIGAAAAPEYMVRGFHPTSVCGVFGAAAGAARLLQLPRSEAVATMGIAGSMASGVFAYLADGASTKPIHAGWAAHAGVTAALLARAGGEGPRSVFEDRFGFFAAYYEGRHLSLVEETASLGSVWETPQVAFKAYPACHFIHGCLDAAAALRQAEGWAAEDVSAITVAVPDPAIPLVLEPVTAKARPRTPYDAKFSLPYSIATMLVRGRVDLSSYFSEALEDADVVALAARVRHERRAFATYPAAFPGWVRLEGPDGEVVERECPYQGGSPENPLAHDDVVRKFRLNAGLALQPDEARALEQALLSIDAVDDLRDCLQALTTERRPEVAA
jgi:2-methylcitrate dehydratase PrpD